MQPPELRIDERLVADIWERQAFDRRVLTALGLELIYRGVPSDAGGPDYQDAIVATEGGATLRGDVEFHVRSCDWNHHGHSRDPRYNSVILHVVWIDDEKNTVRADGWQVPIVALSGATALPLSLDPAGLFPHPCVRSFSFLSTADLMMAIRRLGIERFHERADRFAADLTEHDPDQAIYTALLESLGYASNRAAFRQLAELLPYSLVAALRPDQIATALLDAAGLASDNGGLVPARMAPESWRLSRLRPQNHPAVRLAGVATLLQNARPSLSEYLCTAVLECRRPSRLRQKLMAQNGSQHFIGRGRADEIAVSAVLPFVAALAPSADQPENLYGVYPSPPANRWTRAMQRMMAEAGHQIKLATAPEHQGIHLLYHRYCRRERSDHCPICRSARLRRDSTRR
jgi:hypothetical protein